jgi:hypothetical protein
MVYINVDRLTPPFKKNLQKSNTAEPRCVEVQGKDVMEGWTVALLYSFAISLVRG